MKYKLFHNDLKHGKHLMRCSTEQCGREEFKGGWVAAIARIFARPYITPK